MAPPHKRRSSSGCCGLRSILTAILLLWLGAVVTMVYVNSASAEAEDGVSTEGADGVGGGGNGEEALQAESFPQPPRPRPLPPPPPVAAETVDPLLPEDLPHTNGDDRPGAATAGAAGAAAIARAAGAPWTEPWESRDHGPPPSDPALVGSTWPPPDPRKLARRRLDPYDDAFPPKPARSLCDARGLSGGAFDANKQVLDRITVAPENSDGRSLLCLIYTIEKNHAAAAATARDTWASRCDGFVVMSTAADDSLPSALVTHEGPEAYDNIWQKVRSIWKYVYAAYREDFDWFIIGGDDLYVLPSNLRAYLGSSEVADAAAGGREPLFLGRRFQIPHGQLFNSGGAGYVLNGAALQVLVRHLDDPLCLPHQRVFAEDVNVARCLRKAHGIAPFDTRDKSGAATTAVEEGSVSPLRDLPERFHPFTPGQHLTWRAPKKHKPDGTSADWYENYNMPWGIGTGERCCSPDSVSFHYVKHNLMPHLNALLYECREQ